jgi:hypothetical protein
MAARLAWRHVLVRFLGCAGALFVALAPAAAAGPAVPSADAEVRRPATWPEGTAERAAGMVGRWLEGVTDADARSRGQAAWTAAAAASPDLLDAAMAGCSAVDPRAAQAGAALDAPGGLPDLAWLGESSVTGFERDSVRAWLGRELVRRDRFDEALPLLTAIDPVEAVDPAAVLFHTAACQHWLLDTEAAITTLDRLLERAGEVPVRYERVARLLRADIAALEDESLDHISRRMRDVTRRLGLGRPGPRTRQVQDGVIESLDKLIAKLEQQQQQQNSGANGGGGSSGDGGQGGRPMDDSRIAGGKGPGEVTRKDIGDGDGWGQLPPHKREEALQQIGREYPAHYREAIEQYFKRLAAGEEPAPSR